MLLGRRALSLGLLGAAAGAGAARAQAPWPERPLRWVVGYPPGGPSDTFARLVAAQIGPRLGQNMVVENRVGGGAVLASETVARATPDGYTLLHTDNGNLVYNPALYGRLPYDPDRDLTGVGFIGRFPLFLVVRPDSAIRSFEDYVAASRRQAPTYGSPAVASPHHLAMEMLKRRVGFEATHVPYRGGPAAMQDLLAGTVDSVLIDCATGIPFLRDNKARGLLVMSETRFRPGARRADHRGTRHRPRHRLRLAGHVRPCRHPGHGDRAPERGTSRCRGVGFHAGADARPGDRERALVALGVQRLRGAGECRMAAADPGAGNPAGFLK
ncbi:Bug family tripartite tricarboxylate transporter substrate binding protein [Teichococcus cervicalis]